MLDLEHSFYGAETWTLGKADQKYLDIYFLNMVLEKDGDHWTDHVKITNILHTLKRKKGIWIEGILGR